MAGKASDKPASAPELSKLGQAILDFKARYNVLASNSYGAAIARTGNNQLMQEYGDTLARASQIKSVIENTENAWARAREWSGLGALPLVPIVVVGGLTATVIAGVTMVDRFMRKAGIEQLMAENPGMTMAEAAAQYEVTHRSTFEKTIDTVQLGLLVAAGVGLLWFLRS